MDTKKLTFTILMGALGNVLFLISYLLQIIPSVVALDLSLLVVLIVSLYAGPKAGFLTGLIAGILPGIAFGPAGTGGILGLISLPLGKSLTGLTMGLIATPLKTNNTLHKALLCIPLTLIAYIPEGLFTYAYFTLLLPLFLNAPPIAAFIVNAVMIKAVAEVAIMSIIIAVIVYKKSISNFIETYFYKPTHNKQ
jgi:riboflavin transporter FmnP